MPEREHTSESLTLADLARVQQTERFLLLLNGRNEIAVAIFMTELLANFTLEKPYDLELAPGQDLAERALAG